MIFSAKAQRRHLRQSSITCCTEFRESINNYKHIVISGGGEEGRGRFEKEKKESDEEILEGLKKERKRKDIVVYLDNNIMNL